MISSMVKERRNWSKFKDDKDVSQAQREQDLGKIAKAAEASEFVAPTAWMPKWKREKEKFELEEQQASADAIAAATSKNSDGSGSHSEPMAPMARSKPSLSVVFLGAPRGGKTTMIGHLCHRFGSLLKKELNAIEKKAVLQGRGTKKLAWSIDRTTIEREQDTSIQFVCSSFVSKRFCVCAINVPSQRNFLKNAMTGISQADVAVLVLPMDRNSFEQAIGKDSNTSIIHDHLYACFAFGIRQVRSFSFFRNSPYRMCL